MTNGLAQIKAFKDRSGEITAQKALSDSVEVLALHNLVYDDLKWRHVALLQVLLGNDIVEMLR